MNQYKQAGVDVEKAEAFNQTLASTFKIGLGFAAELDLSRYTNPIISTSADGVGTKAVLQHQYGKYEEMGQDLVAMVFNDIICTGAKPLALLDYIAVDTLRTEELNTFIKGVATSCAYCAAKLVGGETAEMPTLPANSMEVAGFGIGVREKKEVFKPVKKGDILVGLPSSGVHANGFSLIRKVFEGADLTEKFEGEPLIDVLCTPTILYAPIINAIQYMKVDIKGIAHITGGGIYANVKRVVPDPLDIELNWEWEIPEIFNYIQDRGRITFSTMMDTFNLGIGMVVIVNPDFAEFVNGVIIGEVI